MQSKILLVICCFLNFTCAKAQEFNKDSILRAEANGLIFAPVDQSLTTDSFDIKLGNAYVNARRNSKKISTDNFFPKESRALEINYYYKKDSLKYVEVFQKCLLKPGKECFSYYYFDNDKLVLEQTGTKIKLGFQCIGYATDDIKMNAICPNGMDKDFLRNYIMDLLKVIKEY